MTSAKNTRETYYQYDQLLWLCREGGHRDLQILALALTSEEENNSYAYNEMVGKKDTHWATQGNEEEVCLSVLELLLGKKNMCIFLWEFVTLGMEIHHYSLASNWWIVWSWISKWKISIYKLFCTLIHTEGCFRGNTKSFWCRS